MAVKPSSAEKRGLPLSTLTRTARSSRIVCPKSPTIWACELPGGHASLCVPGFHTPPCGLVDATLEAVRSTGKARTALWTPK